MMNNWLSTTKSQTGFTFIETIVAIAIFVIGILLVFSLFEMGYITQDYTFQQALSIEEARRGIETMSQEIREAKIGEDGSFPIQKADSFEFIFFSDINKNSETERVRYFLDGTDFKKGVIEPVGWPPTYPTSSEKIYILSHYVRNSPPIFKYFDSQGNELGPPANLRDIRRVRVFLVININPNRPPQDFVLETDIELRNLGGE